MDQLDYQINPGRDTRRVPRTYAIEGLKVITRALEEGQSGWQSLYALQQNPDPVIARIPERAKGLDVYTNLGDAPQALIINRPDVPQLAEKIEAALQALGALKRTGPNYVNNASSLYPLGPGGIIANPSGVEQIADSPRLLQEMMQQQPPSTPGRG